MRNKLVTIGKDWWEQERPAVEGVRSRLIIAKEPRRFPVGTKMLSTKEAAAELDVSDWTVRHYIKNGELYALPKKKGWQIPTVCIEEFRTALWKKKVCG